MNIQSIALVFMVVVSVGGVGWVLFYPFLSGERQANKRLESVARAEPTVRNTRRQQQGKSRREQIEETLKEIETRAKKPKRPPLAMRITQAGLSWSKRQFFLSAAGFGVAAFVATMLLNVGLLPALAIGFAASFGAPLWLLGFLKNRREKKFLDGFPDAVDVIVRGIKSGLPLLDNLKVIANEAPEPIRSEFRSIVETQTIGIPLGEACVKLYEHIPLAEANFFELSFPSNKNQAEIFRRPSEICRAFFAIARK